MRKQLLKHCCAVFLAGFIALLLLPQAAQAQSKEAYVVKSRDKRTLTFYYDDQKSSRTGSNVWGIEETQESDNGGRCPAWSGTWNTPDSEVTTAVFDASFKNYLPQSTDSWFLGFEKLKKIEGLTNLNTSEVTTMSSMFYGCQSLTSLNLSNFKTENVQNMNNMFAGCYRLTSLNLSNFKTENVQNMSGMFRGCNSLQTIYCNDTWTCSQTWQSWGMFSGCTSLQGAVAYDSSKTDAAMANPETGYFTKKGITGVATATNEGDASIQTIYSTDGRRLNELQRGLNIVRMSNGTTQKILHK